MGAGDDGCGWAVHTDATPQAEAPAAQADAHKVHTGVSCDCCGMNPILGPRFKSLTIDNFDLCAACEVRLLTSPTSTTSHHPCASECLGIEWDECDGGAGSAGRQHERAVPAHRRASSHACARIHAHTGGPRTAAVGRPYAARLRRPAVARRASPKPCVHRHPNPPFGRNSGHEQARCFARTSVSFFNTGRPTVKACTRGWTLL